MSWKKQIYKEDFIKEGILLSFKPKEELISPLIAKDNIVVYKIGKISGYLKILFESICNSYSYSPNANNPSNVLEPVVTDNIYGDYFLEIQQGYHSYNGNCFVRDKIIYSTNGIKFIANYGLKYDTLYIGEFIIPQGAEYFENEKGEIVSSKLYWTGKSSNVEDVYPCTNLVKLKDIEYHY